MMNDKEKLEELVKSHLKDIAGIIQQMIPKNYGFIFMTYEHKNLGQLMYVSNSNRDDVVKCLEEFIEKTKDNYGNDTGKY